MNISEPKHSAIRPEFYGGGNGESFDNAIVINIPHPFIGVHAEYLFIENNFGKRGKDWQLENQALSFHNGRYYDVLKIKLTSGETKVFYFDISNFFGKY